MADRPSPAALKARQRRRDRGVATEAAARAHTPQASLQGLLQLPLLQAIDDAGGRASPGAIYEELAARLGLDRTASERRRCADGQSYDVYEQQVRWARQTAVMKGHLSRETRGVNLP